jgi:hypothetical protein
VAIWYDLWPIGMICGQLVWFVANWYDLWPIGMICGHLAYVFLWPFCICILCPFGMFCAHLAYAFCGHLVCFVPIWYMHFMAIWYVLCPFGYFMDIWYILCPFGYIMDIWYFFSCFVPRIFGSPDSVYMQSSKLYELQFIQKLHQPGLKQKPQIKSQVVTLCRYDKDRWST